ncbi:hypothetical protein HPB50_028403 [Hyalomma asiaticum]|nr:hypothetical protein HPB50_028403 [Hyalomma asiaticum]
MLKAMNFEFGAPGDLVEYEHYRNTQRVVRIAVPERNEHLDQRLQNPRARLVPLLEGLRIRNVTGIRQPITSRRLCGRLTSTIGPGTHCSCLTPWWAC